MSETAATVALLLSKEFQERVSVELQQLVAGSFAAFDDEQQSIAKSWVAVEPQIDTSTGFKIWVRTRLTRKLADGSTQRKAFTIVYDKDGTFEDFVAEPTTTHSAPTEAPAVTTEKQTE